ncbi:hypothetical protein ACB098_06G032100 [Castanea mollissima]
MSSSTELVIILITLAFLSLMLNIDAQTDCSGDFFDLASARNITKCKKLTTLGAEFGWKYNVDNRTKQLQLDIILRASLHNAMGWLAWGVNPGQRPQMVGTRAIIGIRYLNGTSVIKTYNITQYTKIGCPLLPSETSDVNVSNTQVIYSATRYMMTIHASLILPQKDYNFSKLNHVWQVGQSANDVQPLMHATTLQNVDSTETLDLDTGTCVNIGHRRRHLRTVHGILNILGWGILLPIGVIIARYFRVHPFDLEKKKKLWFYLHVSFQSIGYVLGTIGWGIGLWLGHASKYYTFRTHRILAIFIFTFATLQMLAFRLKPKNTDDYRKHWNMYHHFLGYALLATISVNIFQGIAILKPVYTWKWAYVAILGAFGVVTIAFEIYTWIKFRKDINKKKNQTTATNQDLKAGAGPPT